MEKLITLTCPSCGANLEIDSRAKQVSCKYCGNVHLLSDTQAGTITNDPICPISGHQDLILKVSAIIKTEVFTAKPDSESETPITYKSELAQKLICPPQPDTAFMALSTRWGIVGYVLIPVFLIAVLGNIIVSSFLHYWNICGFIVFFAIGTLIAIPIAKSKLAPFLIKKRAKLQAQLKQWHIAKNRWENSYYCQRHDIVFLKDNQEAVPLENFQSFLKRE
jgi:predicted RNA-binding Zn-ribbon protein involved in translation (DUF1610 family)